MRSEKVHEVETSGTVVAGELRLDQRLDLPDQTRVSGVEPLQTGRPDRAGLDSWKLFAKSTPSTPADNDTRGTSCMNAVES